MLATFGALAERLAPLCALVLRHHELGYRANVMCVCKSRPPPRDAIGAQLAQTGAVTLLCYARPARPPHWPHVLFAMVNGKNCAEVDAAIDRLIAPARAGRLCTRGCTLHRYAQRGPHYA